ELVEVADAARLFARPAHPYTLGLLAALPDLDGIHGLTPIEGRIPPLTQVPAGCIFAPRCGFVEAACSVERPALAEIGTPGPMAADVEGTAHLVRCLRWPAVLAAPRRVAEPAAPLDVATPGAAVVTVEHVSKHYGGSSALARRLGLGADPVRAVDEVSFD